ncbi:MAG: hypothetical protein GX595_20400, partial [Lentisphaerae bacterium]|nr:hypothetical protein [Lentisphaerota bacterium]
MTQRYMAAESTRKANVSVWISILGYIPLAYLFYFLGVGLFAYYTARPDAAVDALRQAGRLDSLYAYFVVTRMPPGLAGLVMAAFFAAAMSTISSSMNSCSAVCLEDFYKRFWCRNRDEAHYVFLAKSLTVLWGALTIVMAVLFMRITLAQVVWSKVMAISTCGILGLMALAFLPWKVNRWAGITGVLVSYVVLILLTFFLQIKPGVALVYPIPSGSGVNFLLWPVITNLVSFVVGLAIDRIWPRRQDEPAAAA